MVQTQPETSSGSAAGDSFVADRQIFWSRFTSFTTGAVVVIVVLLVAMWLFLV
ncbi:MAG: hypothetical protein NVSMB18_05020 [Acetobacteraceae bacterium]